MSRWGPRMTRDDEPTIPGGAPFPAQDRLRHELDDWAPIPGAPDWQNRADERQARRFALLAEVIADRDNAIERRLTVLERPDTQPVPCVWTDD